MAQDNEAPWLDAIRALRTETSPTPREFPSGPLLPGRYWKDPPLGSPLRLQKEPEAAQSPAPRTPRRRHGSPTNSQLEEYYSRERSRSRSPWRQWWAKPGYQWDYYETHMDEDGDPIYPCKVYFLNFNYGEHTAEMLVLRIADYIQDVSALLCAAYLSTGIPTAEEAPSKYLPRGLHKHLCNRFNQKPMPSPAPALQALTATGLPGVGHQAGSEQWPEVD